MQLPDVANVAMDRERNIRFVVTAYRRLSRQELLAAVRTFFSMKGAPRPKPNSTYEIITVIGARESV
ncbi:MAG: hypothetical protein IH830_03440 [Planctomycetes bacterium]|nr:hypothetical protein [Planctomycetota bacterium]